MAPGSRCAGDPGFLASLSAQIPEAQRSTPEQAELVAEVQIVPEGKALRASIHVFDRVMSTEAGARELSLPSGPCDETAEALGLVLSVLVEEGRGAKVAPEEPAREPERPPPPPPPAPPPQPETPEKRYVWLGPRAGHDLSVAVGFGYGLLPGVALGGTAGWGIRASRTWPIWLHGSGWLEQNTSDKRARFGTAYGGVSVCPFNLAGQRLRARVCPSFAVGALWASGRGFLEERSSKQILALAGVELGGSVRIVGPLELSLIARAEAPLLRQRFIYYRADGSTPELHQPLPVVVSMFGGLGLRFR